VSDSLINIIDGETGMLSKAFYRDVALAARLRELSPWGVINVIKTLIQMTLLPSAYLKILL
jgi:hypothetical protein